MTRSTSDKSRAELRDRCRAMRHSAPPGPAAKAQGGSTGAAPGPAGAINTRWRGVIGRDGEFRHGATATVGSLVWGPSALVRSRPAARARSIGSERSDGLTLTTAAAAGTWLAPPGWASDCVRMVGCVASAARNRAPAEANTRSETGQLDTVVLPRLVAVAGDRHSVALLNSEADTRRVRTLNLSGRGPMVATGYDNHGRRWRVAVSTGLDHYRGSAGWRIRDRAGLGGRSWSGAEPSGSST